MQEDGMYILKRGHVASVWNAKAEKNSRRKKHTKTTILNQEKYFLSKT